MVRQYAEGEYAAGRMTENGVRIINDFYDGSVAPGAYIRGMTAAYNAGARGADVKGVDTSALTDLQRDAAYLAGQAAGRKGQAEPASGQIRIENSQKKAYDGDVKETEGNGAKDKGNGQGKKTECRYGFRRIRKRRFGRVGRWRRRD